MHLSITYGKYPNSNNNNNSNKVKKSDYLSSGSKTTMISIILTYKNTNNINKKY